MRSIAVQYINKKKFINIQCTILYKECSTSKVVWCGRVGRCYIFLLCYFHFCCILLTTSHIITFLVHQNGCSFMHIRSAATNTQQTWIFFLSTRQRKSQTRVGYIVYTLHCIVYNIPISDDKNTYVYIFFHI